jgi:HPt (histidine-containing phosphotransfer) domain-containing protein
MNLRPAWVLPDELLQLAEYGQKEVVQEVLTIFQSDTAQRLVKVQTAAAAGHRPEVRSQAHAMKGSAAQVGAPTMAALCQTLESQALTAEKAELDGLLTRIRHAFNEVVGAMNG